MQRKARYHKVYLIICAILLLISFVLLCFESFYAREIFYKEFLMRVLLPAILCFAIYHIANLISQKHYIIVKISANLMYIFVVLYQVYNIFLLLFLFFFIFSIDDIEYSNIKDYPKALELYTQESVEHFPREIPQGATNIHFKRTAGGMLGDSTLYLQFNIDENYIKQEALKYKNVGNEYIITNDNSKNLDYNNEYDYDKGRADRTLHALIGDNTGYRFRVIKSESCINGFAYKNKNIIYIIYCD